MYRGIDISSNNGGIDWETVKAVGVEFAIIRIGYGSDIESQDDTQAIRNMQECDRLGIPYGVYLYSYALNIDDAISEVKHALRMVTGHDPKLGIWFDMEDADGYKEKHGVDVYNSRELLTNICRTFCSMVQEAGYKTGVYANKNYWDNVLLADQLTEYPVWLAHWGITEPSMPCLMWQYTSDGEIAGSSPRTDINEYYGELPGTEEPEDTSPEDAEPAGDTYTVQSGDCLSVIAQNLGVDMDQLAAINHIENVNLIYPGQVLTIPGTGSAPAPAENTYTVRSGDTLWGIAERLYGNGGRYGELAEKNGIEDAALIYPGQVIRY